MGEQPYTNNNGNGRVTGLEHDVKWITDALRRIEAGQSEFIKAFEAHKAEDDERHARDATRHEALKERVDKATGYGLAAVFFAQIAQWWLGRQGQ